MKHLKKLASIVLALVMVLAMAIPVMAEDSTTGTITIMNAVDGNTYDIYKIFDLVSYDNADGKNRYSYTVSDTWKNFLSTDVAKAMVTIREDGNVNYVTPVDGVGETEAAAFAQAALQYAKDNSISPTKSDTAHTDDPTVHTTELVFSGLELGYYLVDSTVGTLCSLDSTDADVEINDKNEEPTLEKEVEESGAYGKENDASIGDTVNFQATITAQEGAQKYVMHDTMSQGLTFTGVTGVTLDNTPVDSKNYTVTTPGADGCTFDVTFDEGFCNTLGKNAKIVVSYSATVNDKAAIAGNGNPNKASLSYGDKNRTQDSDTTTYVWDFDMLKVSGDTKQALAGAKFTLNKPSDNNENEAGNPISFVEKSSGSATAPSVYRVATSTDTDTVTEFTTPESGKIKFEGLDSGTYYLTETEAPHGYNMPQKPFKVEIAKDKTQNNGFTVALDGVTSPNKEVSIKNNTGVELPSTGGIGTTIFYIVGGILVVGAAVILVSKKRTKDE